jgi:hypothetical protein
VSFRSQVYTSDTSPDSARTLRHVNDSIRDLAERSLSEESWEFLCECDDLGCLELVELTLTEFDAHRDGDAPILACHHDEG